jgi:formylglycine-generating enzyme
MEGRLPAYYTNAAQTAVCREGQVDLQNDWVNWNGGYRLPTEAEWEKAGRGGVSGHRFPWNDTDTINWSWANYTGGSGSYDTTYGSDVNPKFRVGLYPYTSPVGYFAANGYGLYDMAGNVNEWCWDWYGPYASDSQTDPRGLASGSDRVIRGGSFAEWAFYCRMASRIHQPPSAAAEDLGFRCVLAAGH